MAKRKKNIPVLHISSVENTRRQMPKYNAYAGGYGAFKSKKYPSRQKRKMELQKELHDL